jgi:hypothetical protein
MSYAGIDRDATHVSIYFALELKIAVSPKYYFPVIICYLSGFALATRCSRLPEITRNRL